MTESIEKLINKQKALMDKSEKKTNDQQNLLQLKLNLESEIENSKKTLHEEELNALEITETPIETTRSSAEIEKEMKRIDSIIKINERLLDPKVQDQIFNSYNELNDSIGTVKNDLKDINEYFVELKKSTQTRRIAYHTMLTFIERTVNMHFQAFLRQKDFEGHIDINFHESSVKNNGKGQKGKTLELVIRPRKSTQSQHQSNNEIQSYSSTKSLSGGERSFST
ncbi:hypothetical protein BLA29_010345, partial [Euroglyphus maynei]